MAERVRDSPGLRGQRVPLKGGEQRRKPQEALGYFCALLFLLRSEVREGRPLQDTRGGEEGGLCASAGQGG